MTKIVSFEKELILILEKILDKIIKTKLKLNISAQSRAGAEISDYLEKSFKENAKEISDKICNIETAPKGATKNPWDLKFDFKINKYKEEIWLDFKAIKISSLDSNPDIGTPNKIFDLIQKGYFYIVYIYVFYDQDGDGLKFLKSENKYSKIYLLKDINHTFRRNPKNQLQVNVSSKPEIRSRTEFIEILFEKIIESHKRQIEISKKELRLIENKLKDTLEKNKLNEKKLNKNL